MGPVSDTGRAMMASLQQAMAKGMPIDQAIAYVKGMAQQGVAPMVDLYAMLNQFQRLKQPQAQMPQGGTVKDQIAAAAMQRDHQEAMQRGIASMAAQRAPQEPMQQGLGSVPAPVMEQAQFAGGGIVAFDQGGTTGNPIDYTNLEGVLSNLQSQYGGDPTEYLTREAQAQEAAYERMGLGAARKAREEDIAEQKAEAERYANSAAQTNLAQYFFDLAANASKPGARFLDAAAQAAPGYGQRKTAIDEKTRLLGRAAKEGQLKLMEADELRKAGYLKEAEAKRQEGLKQMIQVGGNIAKEKGEMARAELSAKTSKEVARTYMTHTGSQAEIDRLTQIIATKPRYSEEYREAVERLKIIDPKQAALQTKLSISERNQMAGLYKEQIRGLNKQLEKGIGLDDAERAAIQGQIDAIKEEAASIGIDQKELTGSAGFYGAGIVNPLAQNQNVLIPQRGPVIRPMNVQGNIPPPPSGYRPD